MTYTIGVDIGGTKVLGGVVDENGTIVATARRDTPSEGGHALTRAIADVARELQGMHAVNSIGVSAAGLISSDRSTILATPNIRDWNGVDLKRELGSMIDGEIVIENDANAATWGELRFGAGKGCTELVLLTVGTGVGGGVVSNGELVRGAHGIGAELGHMRLIADGQMCGCGARGCLERYAAGTSLVRYAHEAIAEGLPGAQGLLKFAEGKELKGSHITAAAKSGDPLAISLFRRLGTYLGEAIASIASILDPEKVIIGGGVIEAGDLLLQPARDALARTVPFGDLRPIPEILPAALGNNAGLVGVADLARR